MKELTLVLTPNTQTKSRPILIVGWVALALVLWQLVKPSVFPSPIEVIAAYPKLIGDGLFDELLSSLIVNVEALILSAMIGLPISYLSRVPLVEPLATFIAKLRFVGPAIFYLPLVFFVSGHSVKVLLLTLGQLFYLVTTMSGVVRGIPEYRFDDARTLNMSEWLSVWYVVVRGTVAEAIDAIRDNAAMGWSMLMFVEGIIRSEGGVGVMMINMEKHIEWGAFFAIAIVILVVGVLQDYMVGLLRKAACPYV